MEKLVSKGQKLIAAASEDPYTAYTIESSGRMYHLYVCNLSNGEKILLKTLFYYFELRQILELLVYSTDCICEYAAADQERG